MKDVHFVDNLSFSPDGKLVAVGSSGRAAGIFMRQGDLDAGCAVYSLMMLLVMHRRVNRRDLEQRDKKIGYTAIKRLQDTFLGKLPGLYQDGYNLATLQELLHSSFKKIATASVFTTIGENSISRSEMFNTLRETIDNGFPVEVGFTRRGGKSGHAIVAIGYQEFNNGGDKLRIFCLDPGYELHPQSFWNTIVEIDLNSHNKARYCDLNHSDNCWVDVDEILIIDEQSKEVF